jgi:hypothetical protein
MKGGIFSILALLTLLLIFSSTPSLSQERSNVVSINLVWDTSQNFAEWLFSSNGTLEYQKNINKSSTWAVRLISWYLTSVDWIAKAFGVGGSYRWFFEPTAPEKFYIGGGLDFDFFTASVSFSFESPSSIVLAPKAEAGYRWLFGNFAISIGVEAYYFIGNIKVANVNWPFGGFNFGLVGGLGYAW